LTVEICPVRSALGKGSYLSVFLTTFKPRRRLTSPFCAKAVGVLLSIPRLATPRHIWAGVCMFCHTCGEPQTMDREQTDHNWIKSDNWWLC